MKVAEVRLMIGKPVEWLQGETRAYKGIPRYGIIVEVRGRNVRMADGDWKWLPDMKQLKLREVPNEGSSLEGR